MGRRGGRLRRGSWVLHGLWRNRGMCCRCWDEEGGGFGGEEGTVGAVLRGKEAKAQERISEEER